MTKTDPTHTGGATEERFQEVRRLVREEPEWAVNRILRMDKQVTTLQADTERLEADRDSWQQSAAKLNESLLKWERLGDNPAVRSAIDAAGEGESDTPNT